MRQETSIFLEGVGIGVTLSGIAVEVGTREPIGMVIITCGSVLIALGSVVWKKLK